MSLNSANHFIGINISPKGSNCLPFVYLLYVYGKNCTYNEIEQQAVNNALIPIDPAMNNVASARAHCNYLFFSNKMLKGLKSGLIFIGTH